MVSDGRGIQIEGIVEIVHNFAFADERGRLNASLELVSGIKEERMLGVLRFDDLDERTHVDQTSVGVVLLVVSPLHLRWKSSAVNVVGRHYRNGGKLSGCCNQKPAAEDQ